MSDAGTIAIYDAKAEEYGRLTGTLGETPQLEAFAAALPEGGRVLDLGCGPGYYARALAEMGFQVEAWDASREMVALAQEQGVAEVRQAAFDELEAEARYDGIWANFSLLHARRGELPGLLGRIRRAGTGEMVFHIGMKLGTGEGPDGLGRFYAYYEEDELEALLNVAGFTVVRRWRGEGAGLDGVMARHVMMLCHG